MGAPMAPTVAHARMAASWSGNRPTNAGWNPLRPGRVQVVGMQNEKVVDTWRTRGFVILPAFLSAEDLAPALGELEAMFPTSEGFHDGTDSRRTRYVEDEFDGSMWSHSPVRSSASWQSILESSSSLRTC
jgi:hypothetical protein